MSQTEYTYAVARIRSLENSLLNSSDIERMLSAESTEAAVAVLAEKGYDASVGIVAMMGKRREEMWKTVREMAKDEHLFDVLLLPHLYHNLGVAIKQTVTDIKIDGIFYEDTLISPEKMLEAVQNKSFDLLPFNMKSVATDAYETFLHTADSQLLDIIVDKGCLDAIIEAGKNANEKILSDYAEKTVAMADIKIAVRAAKTGKSQEFLKRALAPCSSFSVDALAVSAISGVDGVLEFMSECSMNDGADALKKSANAFECWCDNGIIESIKPQKYNSFSAGPLIAFAIAFENELKTVRIILTGKENGLSSASIRERVREMYV